MIHTLLLIPPPGNTSLLADEAGGGRVPTLTWCWAELTNGRDLWCKPSQGARPHEPRTDGLLLIHGGLVVPMACDRAYRVSRPVHDERRRVFLSRVDERAKVTPGTNLWQARYSAFNALVQEGVDPVEGLPFVYCSAYAIEDAIQIAKWAADILGARVIALDSNRNEVAL